MMIVTLSSSKARKSCCYMLTWRIRVHKVQISLSQGSEYGIGAASNQQEVENTRTRKNRDPGKRGELWDPLCSDRTGRLHRCEAPDLWLPGAQPACLPFFLFSFLFTFLPYILSCYGATRMTKTYTHGPHPRGFLTLPRLYFSNFNVHCHHLGIFFKV